MLCFLQSVFAFKWALENFATEEDSVVIYHVNQSIPPVTTAGTGECVLLGCCDLHSDAMLSHMMRLCQLSAVDRVLVSDLWAVLRRVRYRGGVCA